MSHFNSGRKDQAAAPNFPGNYLSQTPNILRKDIQPLDTAHNTFDRIHSADITTASPTFSNHNLGIMSPSFPNLNYNSNPFNPPNQPHHISQPHLLAQVQPQIPYNQQSHSYQQSNLSSSNNLPPTPTIQTKQKSKVLSKTAHASAYTASKHSSQIKAEDSSSTAKSGRKKKVNVQKRDYAQVSDETLPINDEADTINARDISIARYKKYHDYIACLFTPLHTNNFKYESPYKNLNQSLYTQKIENAKKELESLKDENKIRAEQMQANRLRYLNFMKELENATDLDDELLNKELSEIFLTPSSVYPQPYYKTKATDIESDTSSAPVYLSL
ncbi:hypothetical protein BB561_004575 [Smittium simulii]|uniref:Uncharacterized protein n=1 Tax=Smittium simulii TaxID=133385 RepID=A0A2T9YFE0_9FUNG|nr:hypothetical protein BB561_004575 [Smittium simulii]